MLVGRGTERRLLERLVAGARTGTAGVLVLTGEAGVGKSALLADGVALAGDMQVLRVTGTEAEHDVPFGGLLTLLRPLLGHLDRIPGPQAESLAAALALRPGHGADRFAVGAATLSLLGRAAEERAVLIAVDDAHLLDRPSAQALVFAARRLLADPVVLLAALRTGTSSPLQTAGLPEHELGGLDVAATRDLVTRHAGAGPPALADHLHRATGGNPLAIIELLREKGRLDRAAPGAPLPVTTTAGEVFARRAADLPAPARTALLAAVVAGADLPLTARTCQALGTGVGALAAAEEAGLVHVTDGRIEFRHPLVRSAVYAAAGPAERRAAHAAVAGALPAHAVERRAWHRAEAAIGPDPAVAADLAAAGRHAAARGAHAIAATAWERSARLTPDDDTRAARLTDAGESAWLAGDPVRALALLAEARDLLPAARAGRVQRLRGVVAARSGSPAEARDLLLAAAGAADGTDPTDATGTGDLDPDAAILLLADAVHTCFYLADARSALRAAQRLDVLLAGPCAPGPRALGTMAAGMALVLAGRGGVDRIRTATELLTRSPEIVEDPRRPVWLLLGPLWLREGDARHALAAEVDELRARSAAGTLPYLLFHLARDDATTDRWSAAEAGYDEGIRLAREAGQTTDLAACLAGLAWLRARQGRSQDCRRAAAEVAAICERSDITFCRVWVLFALGELELSLDRPDAALARFRELEDLLAGTGLEDVDLSPAPEITEALLRLGRPDEAAGVAAGHRSSAEAKGQPWSLARAGRLTLLLAADDDLDAAATAALARHARTTDVFETARTRLALGARLRRARRRADSRDPLRAALADFERLGAQPWADAAARELQATGETARRRGAPPDAALTPQERQIATMLAGGRTTRETAAALFLSPKTVEYHLRHVYQKLGISSRPELAEHLDGA